MQRRQISHNKTEAKPTQNPEKKDIKWQKPNENFFPTLPGDQSEPRNGFDTKNMNLLSKSHADNAPEMESI